MASRHSGFYLLDDITTANTKAVQTDVNAGDTLLIKAYDVDGAAYTTMATITANNTPTWAFNKGIDVTGDLVVRNAGSLWLPFNTNTSGDAIEVYIQGYLPSLRFNDMGQTDPAGHFSITSASNQLQFAEATGAGWSAANLILTYDGLYNWVFARAILMGNGVGIRSGYTAGHTMLLQAYDVDGGGWTTFITLTSNNTPTCTITGATITGALLQTSTDGGALGSGTVMWSDLFLASGGTINFNNGDVVLTHSTGILTLTTGTLALGANNLTMSGSIGVTGTRVTKGWFTDLEVTNAIAGSVTGNAGSATYASATTITDDTTTVATMYPLWVTTNTGNLPTKVSSTKLFFVPSTGILTATGFSGALTGNVTGNVSGSSGSCTGNAATVTTNANLTGVITSVGNATSIASQTGTGTKFVVDTSPTLVTPVLGVATATSINKIALTAVATGATLTILDGKTLTISNSLTFAGTDGQTFTFPTTSDTVACLGKNNNFSVTQYLGDTSNANMTLGLTINNGTAVDEAISLKHTDVAHGMTDYAETDTFAAFYSAGANGGMTIRGFCEVTSALVFQGYGTTENTTKSTSGLGYINIYAFTKSGAGRATPGADTNLVAIMSGTTTRFIFDAEGTLHHITADNDLAVFSLSATTGTPTLTWDESEDAFSANCGLILSDAVTGSKNTLYINKDCTVNNTRTWAMQVMSDNAGTGTALGCGIDMSSFSVDEPILKTVADAITGGSLVGQFAIDIAGTTRYVPYFTDGTGSITTTTLTFIIDGGGSAITTGQKGHLEIPFACTINQVTLLADTSGSIVIDVWKDTYANFPPTDADSITASAVPTITTATKSQDATLTGWTTAVVAGDILAFNVDSCTTITRCTVSLRVLK